MFGDDNKMVKWFWRIFGTFTILAMVATLFAGFGAY